MPPGYRLVSLASVGSTNTEVMRLASAGDPGRIWLVADEQLSGRGRSGRGWTSVPGNLYASLLLRLSCGPMIAPQLALVAGVAVARAVAGLLSDIEYSGMRGRVAEVPDEASQGSRQLRLKWPNDVLIGGAKLGGILLESAQRLGGPGLVAVVGIGLNVAGVPQGLGRAATSLSDCGVAADRDRVLTHLAAAMDAALLQWDEGGGFAQIRAAWETCSGPIGERLSVNSGTGPVAGRYKGLDRDGALMLIDDMGETHRFTYGDVTLAAMAREQ